MYGTNQRGEKEVDTSIKEGNLPETIFIDPSKYKKTNLELVDYEEYLGDEFMKRS